MGMGRVRKCSRKRNLGGGKGEGEGGELRSRVKKVEGNLYCNTLQHPATLRNTLQHTATPCIHGGETGVYGRAERVKGS